MSIRCDMLDSDTRAGTNTTINQWRVNNPEASQYRMSSTFMGNGVGTSRVGLLKDKNDESITRAFVFCSEKEKKFWCRGTRKIIVLLGFIAENASHTSFGGRPKSESEIDREILLGLAQEYNEHHFEIRANTIIKCKRLEKMGFEPVRQAPGNYQLESTSQKIQNALRNRNN